MTGRAGPLRPRVVYRRAGWYVRFVWSSGSLSPNTLGPYGSLAAAHDAAARVAVSASRLIAPAP